MELKLHISYISRYNHDGLFFFLKKRKLYTVQHNPFQLEQKFSIFNMSL